MLSDDSGEIAKRKTVATNRQAQRWMRQIQALKANSEIKSLRWGRIAASNELLRPGSTEFVPLTLCYSSTL